jgi:hypothetical protein
LRWSVAPPIGVDFQANVAARNKYCLFFAMLLAKILTTIAPSKTKTESVATPQDQSFFRILSTLQKVVKGSSKADTPNETTNANALAAKTAAQNTTKATQATKNNGAAAQQTPKSATWATDAITRHADKTTLVAKNDGAVIKSAGAIGKEPQQTSAEAKSHKPQTANATDKGIAPQTAIAADKSPKQKNALDTIAAKTTDKNAQARALPSLADLPQKSASDQPQNANDERIRAKTAVKTPAIETNKSALARAIASIDTKTPETTQEHATQTTQNAKKYLALKDTKTQINSFDNVAQKIDIVIKKNNLAKMPNNNDIQTEIAMRKKLTNNGEKQHIITGENKVKSVNATQTIHTDQKAIKSADIKSATIETIIDSLIQTIDRQTQSIKEPIGEKGAFSAKNNGQKNSVGTAKVNPKQPQTAANSAVSASDQKQDKPTIAAQANRQRQIAQSQIDQEGALDAKNNRQKISAASIGNEQKRAQATPQIAANSAATAKEQAVTIAVNQRDRGKIPIDDQGRLVTIDEPIKPVFTDSTNAKKINHNANAPIEKNEQNAAHLAKHTRQTAHKQIAEQEVLSQAQPSSADLINQKPQKPAQITPQKSGASAIEQQQEYKPIMPSSTDRMHNPIAINIEDTTTPDQSLFAFKTQKPALEQIEPMTPLFLLLKAIINEQNNTNNNSLISDKKPLTTKQKNQPVSSVNAPAPFVSTTIDLEQLKPDLIAESYLAERKLSAIVAQAIERAEFHQAAALGANALIELAQSKGINLQSIALEPTQTSLAPNVSEASALISSTPAAPIALFAPTAITQTIAQLRRADHETQKPQKSPPITADQLVSALKSIDSAAAIVSQNAPIEPNGAAEPPPTQEFKQPTKQTLQIEPTAQKVVSDAQKAQERETQNATGEPSADDWSVGLAARSNERVKIHAARVSLSRFASYLTEAIENYRPPFTRMVLQMEPQSLGAVEVVLSSRGNRLNVTINGSQTAIALLSQPEFRQNLLQSGFNEVDFHFNGDESKGSGAQSRHERQDQRDRHEYNDEGEEGTDFAYETEMVNPALYG